MFYIFFIINKIFSKKDYFLSTAVSNIAIDWSLMVSSPNVRLVTNFVRCTYWQRGNNRRSKTKIHEPGAWELPTKNVVVLGEACI